MEECPKCGQIPEPDDESCPHCGFPFDEAAQRHYRSPHLKKIEEEILSQVIARVEAYWSAHSAEGEEKSQAPAAVDGRKDTAGKVAVTPAGDPGRRGLSDLLKWLAWIHLGLGLASAVILWEAVGAPGIAAGPGIIGAGYTAPLLVVLSVFFGVAGCVVLRAVGAILEALDSRRG
ncbi:MAG: zinc ribbon domain-containing protein [Desulfobacterales bacterium]|nr:zinc ribbon domain-containing protein [Desulfobacterales bacterium]